MDKIDKKTEALLFRPKRSCPTPRGDYIAVSVADLDKLEKQRDNLIDFLIREKEYIETEDDDSEDMLFSLWVYINETIAQHAGLDSEAVGQEIVGDRDGK